MTGAKVYVRWPDPHRLREYLRTCETEPTYLRSDANQYSLVLEVQFGGTRVVLPGDLPRTVAGSIIPTGSNALMERHSSLGDH